MRETPYRYFHSYMRDVWRPKRRGVYLDGVIAGAIVAVTLWELVRSVL